jgi:hypothetical protein
MKGTFLTAEETAARLTDHQSGGLFRGQAEVKLALNRESFKKIIITIPLRSTQSSKMSGN